MNSTRLRVALQALGGLLLAIAVVRFAAVFFRSLHASELSPPAVGWVVGFSIDCVTAIIGAIGALLFMSGYLLGRSRV